MSDIVIFGTGDIAKLAHYYLVRDSIHKVVAFTVDRDYLTNEKYLGLPVVPFDVVEANYPPDRFNMFIALSYSKMNTIRANKFSQAKKLGYKLISYLSSKCTFLSESDLGENCFILEDNTIQPFVQIGNNVTLWSGNHIGHDSLIEDHVFVSSHVVISGHVRVGSHSFLGVNSTIHNGVALGTSSLISAGAIIAKNTAANSVHVPARSSIMLKQSGEIDL